VAFLLELADDGQFIVGQQVGMHFGDVSLAGDGLCRAPVIAGQHQHALHAAAFEFAHHFGGVVAQRVGDA